MSLKNTVSKRQHMLLQNVFSINGAFTDVQVTHEIPPIPLESLALNIWMVVFLFDPENMTSIMFIKNLKG